MRYYTLAVDPSVNSPGVAMFNPSGELIATKRFQFEESTDPIGTRCARVALEIRRWYLQQATPFIKPYLVFEWPQIYRASKSKGDPNDLIALAGIGMALAGMLECGVSTPTPAQWAGQLKKFTKGDVGKSPRALRIRSRLSAEEMQHWQDQHDVIDAIGLGLWSLDRLAPRRVYPGAT